MREREETAPKYLVYEEEGAPTAFRKYLYDEEGTLKQIVQEPGAKRIGSTFDLSRRPNKHVYTSVLCPICGINRKYKGGPCPVCRRKHGV